MPCQIGDGIFESAPEVWIRRRASVPRPPGRIDDELLKIGEPAILRDSGYSARWQHREPTQVNRLRTFRYEIVVEKSMMADLIVGVIGDVLRHIAVKNLKGSHVARGKAFLDGLAVEYKIDGG
jgi:hypothetical protein